MPRDAASGPVVVITGAASGIGAALARHWAMRGARLMLADVDEPRLLTLTQSIRQQGGLCESLPCDVADRAQVEQLALACQAHFGAAQVLVNNAGVALVDPLASMRMQDAQWIIGINFWGVVHGSQAFIPQLQSHAGSTIVNLSSIFAMLSLPSQSMYNASKAAVRAFSDALREELRHPTTHASAESPARHPVNVLCVHPGGVRTRIVEQARIGDLRSVAPDEQTLKNEFLKVARTTPEQAAEAIVRAVDTRRTRLLIGTDARIGDLLYRIAPGRASAWFSSLARRRRTGA
jgi:short-subunit dehydrogenase